MHDAFYFQVHLSCSTYIHYSFYVANYHGSGGAVSAIYLNDCSMGALPTVSCIKANDSFDKRRCVRIRKTFSDFVHCTKKFDALTSLFHFF